MVMPDNGQHWAERFQVAANVFAPRRVGAHNRPFLRGQGAGLEQNRIRNSHLAHVMQITTAVKRQQAGAFQPHDNPHGHAYEGQALAMPGEIVVALLDRLPQRQQQPFRLVVK